MNSLEKIAVQRHTPHEVLREDRPDGSILLRSRVPNGPVEREVGAWVEKWARRSPDQVFVAERSGAGWRELRYGELLQRVRAVASALAARGLGPDRPICILSGNGVDHAVLTLAAQYVGVPVVPLAEQYSLVPEAHGRLKYVVETVRPGLVFADDGGPYGAALGLDFLQGIEKVVARDAGHSMTAFDALLKGDHADLAAIRAGIGPDTLAKIMFTSGSTDNPKGVLTTQRMLCVNQAQMAAVMPAITARAPKILDWLPWNHTFGGSHTFNMVLSNGGSLYIDDGKPTRSGFAASVRNMREHAGNLAFNVPIGFAKLIEAMQGDEALKRAYLGDCDMILYAGASVSKEIWSTLAGFAKAVRGQVPLMCSGWGMTETSPAAIQVHQPVDRPGYIGVPFPEVTAKLVPVESERFELRVKGPNVMPGYFEAPDKTLAAFDEEGFLITHDAVRFVDADDANAGLKFDGRLSEDFKLTSGTWVHATSLRLEALKYFADIASDLVVVGHDRAELGLLIFPHASQPEHEQGGAVVSTELRAQVAARLQAMAVHATGSSTRIARAMVLSSPPSVGEGELTAKGSLNSRKVLALRAPLLERLYDDQDPATVRL